MREQRGLFTQNVIAIIWDFDKTLSPVYMQEPLFRAYGIDSERFWEEVHNLPDYYRRAGIHVQPDTCYLGHLLTYVREGRMPGLTNAKLRELGGEIEFFPGVAELFDALEGVMETPRFQEIDLRVEHYVVSTGLAEIVRGTAIAPRLAGIWASEFIEEPAPPDFDPAGAPREAPISQIASFLDNTTKTRAIFEINKGVNKIPHFDVNATIPEDARRVPIEQMIYVADGPSDIPSFSVVRRYGGMAYAVYDPSSTAHFAKADQLRKDGRVDSFGPADYCRGSHTHMWLVLQVQKIADRIVKTREEALARRVAPGPVHIEDSVVQTAREE